jgi:hypothetical protein
LTFFSLDATVLAQVNVKGARTMGKADLDVTDDFAYLTQFLPQGWQAKAKELGALRRCRKVPDAETLLRVLLIHLGEGCSLRETAVRAREGELIDLSDVAIMDRLKQAGEWFRWMNAEIMNGWVATPPPTVFGAQWNIRLVDGTRVKEPGPTGSSWCIHYAIGLPSLACDELIVSDTHGNGESFRRFSVKAGDLFIGDRVYGVRPGIFHVCEAGGEVLVRFAIDNLPLETPNGRRFNLLKHLRTLTGTKLGDWPVQIRNDEGATLSGRVCAARKSRQAAEKARKHIRRQAQKSGSKPKPETLEAAGYIFVFTTIVRAQLPPRNALEMYRGRWQIELVFKRLKSIIALGHLRKTDPQATRAWIHGKLLVALLIEALIQHGESFFPWGYPLLETPGPQPLLLAGGTAHAPSAANNR